MAWFLEPAYVEWLDEDGKMNGLIGRPSAIGINRQNEVGTCRLACSVYALGIRWWRQTPDLELAARHPGSPIGLHLAPHVSKRLTLHILAADRLYAQLLAKS